MKRGAEKEDLKDDLSIKRRRTMDENDGYDADDERENRDRLFLGGGDFSYELSYVEKHPSVAWRTIATTFDTYEQAKEKYGDSFEDNALKLRKKGVELLHGVDATRLSDRYGPYEDFDNKFKTVHFSHPHTGSRTFHTSTNLLNPFFSSAADFLEDDAKILMPHSRSTGHYGFKKKDQDDLFPNLSLKSKHAFSDERYPGYVHRETLSGKSAASVDNQGSVESVFRFSRNPEKKRFYGSNISTDSGSESVSGDESS